MLFLLIVPAVLATLFVGYYDALEDAETHKVYFIKTSPTFQVRFRQLFANDKPLAQLSKQEREVVINYCKYRLGLETHLETQEELDVCKQR